AAATTLALRRIRERASDLEEAFDVAFRDARSGALLERPQMRRHRTGGRGAGAGQREVERAAVLRVSFADDERSLLETIDHARQGRAPVPERRVKLGKRRAVACVEKREHVGLGLRAAEA